MSQKKIILIGACCVFLSSCTVGPDYVKPKVSIPAKFKEAKQHWKKAEPQDAFNRGNWWQIFHDPELNALEDQVNVSNQTIAAAAAQYQQALALVDAARASYFPNVAASAAVSRQKESSSLSTTSATSTNTGGAFTSHSLLLNATWEPDIWGGIHRQVEANMASAESLSALLASARLSAEASLAQFYFELRALDEDQKILDDTVKEDKKLLQLTKNQYASGVVSESDILQAKSQLENAEALALNNGIARSQYEHAIAILIGKSPAEFSLPFKPSRRIPPTIPITVPSALLERRPDIAAAERLMAEANAEIGVAESAYFPALTLSGSANYAHRGLEDWISMPNIGWSLGPQLAETLLDGGLRRANVKAAQANYAATVANYRETVLTAFQDVEDNLVALRILAEQRRVQDKAAVDAHQALRLVTNQYQAGTVAYSSVLTAQIAAFSAEKTAADVRGLQMSAAVGLIKALGGGWVKA